ncbi:protein kinase superfamily protein [Wolffia australiana]
MKAESARALAAAVTGSLLLLLVVLWVCFGFSRTFFIFLGIDSAAILGIAVWAAINYSSLDRRLSLARRRAVDGEELRAQYSLLRKEAGLPTPFPYDQLEAATDNFRTVLGSGASAAVFKGVLPDGTAVAVKRLPGDARGDAEFRAEVAALAAVQHVNLVRLLGYCLIPRGPRFLVYEFMENGSLSAWIFPGGAARPLPWRCRHDVAVEVARALAYLHHDCRSRVLHLDVKPENILLDGGFRARLADLGLSQLLRGNAARVVTDTRGTPGYLAPEWLSGAGVSDKSDVYSFGLVLLELVAGRRNIRKDGARGTEPGTTRDWSFFPRTAAEMVREGREMEALDARLRGEEMDERQVKGMVRAALWCVQDDPARRPCMARVVEMLCGDEPVETPPETDMVVVRLLGLDEGDEAAPPRPVGERDPSASVYFASVSTVSPR